MSTDETLGHNVQREDGHDHTLTAGILSLAIGLTAALGGGTLASAFQYWAFELTARRETGFVAQTASAVPPIVLGIVAVALGLIAARSSHTTASATGRAGVVVGVLAIIGGLALAIALGTSDFS